MPVVLSTEFFKAALRVQPTEPAASEAGVAKMSLYAKRPSSLSASVQNKAFFHWLNLVAVDLAYAAIKVQKNKLGKSFSVLDLRSCLALKTTCSEATLLLDTSPLWLAEVRHEIMNPGDLQDNFSLFLLSAKIFQALKHGHWTRKVMKGVLETPPDNSQWTSIVAHTNTEETESYFWDKLKKHFATRAVPTLSNVKDMTVCVISLIQLSLPKQESEGAPSAEAENSLCPQDIVDKVATFESLNKVFCSILCAMMMSPKVFMELLPDGSYRQQVVDHIGSKKIVDTRTLLPTVDSIGHTVATLNGLTVEQLRVKPWVFPHKRSIPKSTRRVLVGALAKLSPLQLFGTFTSRGLWKTIYHSIHIRSMLSSKRFSEDGLSKGKVTSNELKDMQKMYLFVLMLMEEKYPKNEEEFETSLWRERVVAPLKALCDAAGSIFKAKDPAWLQPTFQSSLSRKRLPKPDRVTVTNLLSMRGNTKETWTMMFEEKILSESQVYMNIRNLILLNFPVSVVKDYVVKKRASQKEQKIDLIHLMKIKHLIENDFTNDFIREVAGLIDVANNMVPLSEKLKLVQSSNPIGEDEIFVEMPLRAYTDLKGQVYAARKYKVVSKGFNESSVQEYLAFIMNDFECLLAATRQSLALGTKKVISLISLTPELHDNVIRSGLPPIEPPYSKVSMWRGEVVCINQLLEGGENTDSKTDSSEADGLELILGISWCQKQKGPVVDLDLSCTMYDDKWEPSGVCNFQNMNPTGMKHSGDITIAPYPKGARENIRIQFSKLPKNIKYVVLTVHNYTRQPISECCSDASIFVADGKRTGRGPGGLAMIAASSLKSEGTTVVAGAMIVDRKNMDGQGRPVLRLLSIDSAPKKVTSTVATESTNMNRDFAKRSVDNSGYMGKPSKMPLVVVAALNAVLVSSGGMVVIEHGEDENVSSPTIVTRQEGDTLSSFLQAILRKLETLPVTLEPNYANAFGKVTNADCFVVLGCECDTKRAREMRSYLPYNGEDKREGGKKLCVVNQRTHKADSDVVDFKNIGEVMVLENMLVANEVISYVYDKNP